MSEYPAGFALPFIKGGKILSATEAEALKAQLMKQMGSKTAKTIGARIVSKVGLTGLLTKIPYVGASLAAHPIGWAVGALIALSMLRGLLGSEKGQKMTPEQIAVAMGVQPGQISEKERKKLLQLQQNQMALTNLLQSYQTFKVQ